MKFGVLGTVAVTLDAVVESFCEANSARLPIIVSFLIFGSYSSEDTTFSVRDRFGTSKKSEFVI